MFQFHPNHLLLLKVSQIVGPPTFLHSVSPMSDRKSEVFAISGVGLFTFSVYYQERIQDFKLGKGKNLGVFHVKNHDFMPKNHIFSNFLGGGPGSAPDYEMKYIMNSV